MRVLRQSALHQGFGCRSGGGAVRRVVELRVLGQVRRPTEGGARLSQAIAWGEQDLDKLWQRLREHFSEPELVELGCFIALTFGQQSWIRLLGIDHHQYMAGTDASMAPGFANADELAASKARDDYWANR
jgi:hypothetical protein